jgi:CPA1 family monovalent cation:H+ antiporter
VALLGAVAVIGVTALAPRTGVSAPLILVLLGIGISLLPAVPAVEIAPEWILAGVLPPLLYSTAVSLPTMDFRRDLAAIGGLSVVLVVVTAVLLGLVFSALLPGLGLAGGIALGAIVSPTDAVATSIVRKLGAPPRVVTVLEGEGLLNDGTALVLLRAAILAGVAGSFSPWEAGGRLALNIVGGVAVGLAIGYLIRRVRRVLDNPPLEVTIAFLTGYFAFLPASALGVSGVLAVVTAGVYMGWYTPELTTVQTRLQGQAFWEILTFLLNVLLFGLVGLQLRPILDALSGTGDWSLVGHATVIVLAVIVLRIVWVFPGTYVPRWLIPRVRERDPSPPWRYPAFIAWNGMRGAVTIAAALLIPLRTDAGLPFPGRSLILFFAFAVVLGTLVVQGLSLPLVIRALRLETDDGDAEAEEAHARVRAAEAALERLDELESEGWVLEDTAGRARGLYRFRIDRFSARTDPDGDGKIEKRSLKYQRLRRELLDAERHAVIELRNAGEISDEVMRRVEHDLDLELARLDQ